MTLRRAGLLCVVLVLLAGGAAAETLGFVSNIAGGWIDVSQVGQKLPLFGADVAEINTTIGNRVFPAGRVLVGNNGGIGFDPPPCAGLSNYNFPIPSPAAFLGAQSLVAHWDNLEDHIDPGVTWGEKDNTLVVEYIRHIFGTDIVVEFQIQVPGQTERSDVRAQFVYREIDAAGGGASATIGYQDGGAGFNDAQWSFNTPGAVTNGMVLTLVPEPAAGAASLLLIAVKRRR